MTEAKQATPHLELKKIYLKDVSFESPKSPYAFSAEQAQPVINVEVTISSKRLDPEKDYYEVILHVTITAKADDEQHIVYLCEVQQAGLFTLSHPNPQNLEAMIGIACPSILLPYAREAIHNITGKGGFEPLMINPMNFDAAFRQRKQIELEKQNANNNANQPSDDSSAQSEESAAEKPTIN